MKEFNDYRQRMNEIILSKNNLVLNVYGTLIPILIGGRIRQEHKRDVGSGGKYGIEG